MPKIAAGAQDHFHVSYIKIHPVLFSQDGKTLLPQNYEMDYKRGFGNSKLELLAQVTPKGGFFANRPGSLFPLLLQNPPPIHTNTNVLT